MKKQVQVKDTTEDLIFKILPNLKTDKRIKTKKVTDILLDHVCFTSYL